MNSKRDLIRSLGRILTDDPHLFAEAKTKKDGPPEHAIRKGAKPWEKKEENKPTKVGQIKVDKKFKKIGKNDQIGRDKSSLENLEGNKGKKDQAYLEPKKSGKPKKKK